MERLMIYDSPIGKLTLSGDGASITGLWIEGQKHFGRTLKMKRNIKNPIVCSLRREGGWIIISGENRRRLHFLLHQKAVIFRKVSGRSCGRFRMGDDYLWRDC